MEIKETPLCSMPRYSGCSQNSGAQDPYDVDVDLFRCRKK